MESDRGNPSLLEEQLQRTLQSLQEAARGGEDPAVLIARIQSLDVSPTPDGAVPPPDPLLAGAHLGLLRHQNGIPDPAQSQPLLPDDEEVESVQDSLEEVQTPQPGSPVGGGSL